MGTWFIIITSLCIPALLKLLFDLLSTPDSNLKHTKIKGKLPPGPFTFPIIGNFLWLRKTFSDLEPILRNLHAKYGPVVTLPIGLRPAIFVRSHSLAHQALVQNGAVFTDRPAALPTENLVSSNQHNINTAAYGPTWRVLRRNLAYEMLHPSRLKSFSHARSRALHILVSFLKSHSQCGDCQLANHFQYSMFCVLVFMCFGDNVDEKKIREIEMVVRELLVSLEGFGILDFWPRLGKILFWNRWKELKRLWKAQEDLLVPLIRAITTKDNQHQQAPTYVETLIDLELPEEKRKLKEGEMVTLCSEFLAAGTDTTWTALEWIMANLVKHPHVQEKLFAEIKEVAGGAEVIKEEELERMPYLKAVVLEGLRRHPPAHFVLPHAVTEETTLGGYVVPRNATVNFLVAEMGWDPEVWEDPMGFKPERFVEDGKVVFDIAGSKEIKAMPFGVGRRMCPGSGLAMLHLEYFVANLVWNFEWASVEGDGVDLSEKYEFTTMMKYPLRASLSSRHK
ncbi:cytochrome P450 89A2-like [Malania oleifera]|uniref:cytochrome P450 89A2-like n=1 Tax=Malania oleifera TaxID=397392 RepID=UPI0025ADB01B|nr:cytochrome P450 89A2-like [Malania oleifera]